MSGTAATWPVLVPDAHAIGMIAVIRSLGRAGYPVHACASDPDALGLGSAFASHRVVCPSYEDPGFLGWLARYVREHGIRTIVPSEGFLLAVREVFGQYAALLPVPRDADRVYRSLSKASVLGDLLDQPATAAHLPPTCLFAEGAVPPVHDLQALGTPLFVKTDAVDAKAGGSSRVIREASAAAAHARALELLAGYHRVLVQGFVPGQGTGAYFLVAAGGIRQEFANRCLHEVPHTGGFCSLRESWWNEAMMEDARIKMRHLGWEGVAMLEYRYDPDSGRFWFIELNARFWAALHLALFSGVDFPRMLLDTIRGEATRRESFPLGVLCRFTIPYDVGYVLSRWRDPALGLPAKLGSVAGWFGNGLDPRIHSDLWFPRDRRLYWQQWRKFLGQWLGSGRAKQARRRTESRA